MNCPYCNKKAEWVENKVIYGKNYGKSYMCHYCKDCDAYVGCHNNTKTPLGTMANPELKKWRRKVHAYIDPLWKDNKIHRKNLYEKLSFFMGKEYHTGNCDIKDCKKVLNISLKLLIKV